MTILLCFAFLALLLPFSSPRTSCGEFSEFSFSVSNYLSNAHNSAVPPFTFASSNAVLFPLEIGPYFQAGCKGVFGEAEIPCGPLSKFSCMSPHLGFGLLTNKT